MRRCYSPHYVTACYYVTGTSSLVLLCDYEDVLSLVSRSKLHAFAPRDALPSPVKRYHAAHAPHWFDCGMRYAEHYRFNAVAAAASRACSRVSGSNRRSLLDGVELAIRSELQYIEALNGQGELPLSSATLSSTLHIQSVRAEHITRFTSVRERQES